MPNVKNIKRPTQKRTEGFVYNFEKKLFHEKEIKAAETERKKMKPVKFIRFENGVEVISYHQPVNH
jgi:hypothetical protein